MIQVFYIYCLYLIQYTKFFFQDAAIFVFEKKTLEKYSRKDKEIIIEALKKGAAQLTRLRHPKVLSVIQPLEESRYI